MNMTTDAALGQDEQIHMPTPVQSPRKKGHGNAIITYELLAEFSSKLTAVATRLEGVLERLHDGAVDHDGLEARVRILEATAAGASATDKTSERLTDRAWSNIISVLSLIISAGTLILVATRH